MTPQACSVPNFGSGDNPALQAATSLTGADAIALACALARVTSVVCDVAGVGALPHPEGPRGRYTGAPWLEPYVWELDD